MLHWFLFMYSLRKSKSHPLFLKTSRGPHRSQRRQRHALKCGCRPPAGIPDSPGDGPASPRGHAGSQTGHAACAASSRHARSSSTSIHLASEHAPTNDAPRPHVSPGQIQNADALPSTRPRRPPTSFHGTRRGGWPGRAAVPERQARIWVPATFPQRGVVEVS